MNPSDPDFQYLGFDRKKYLKEIGEAAFDSKKNCWIPDDKEGYVAAMIESQTDTEVTARCNKTKDVSRGDSYYFGEN